MATTLSYGFTGLAHLANERIYTVGEDTVWQAVQDTVAEHNRIVNGMMTTFVQRTTDHKRRLYVAGSGTLQPGSEWATPSPVRAEGYFDIAYPINHGMDAFGTSRVSEALITVEEANRLTQNVMLRDADWLKRHMLASMLYSSEWTYNDTEYGELTIKPLANAGNDSQTYLKRGGTVATDTHYLAQAAAISASALPFGTIWTELSEHPENGQNFVTYVASDQVAAIEALTALVEVNDPAIDYGADSDVLAGGVNDPFGMIRGFGTRVLGRISRMWIVEWPSLPSGYLLGVALSAMEPVLKMREYPAATLQGLQTKQIAPNEALMKRSFYRDAGFGVHNRVGAVAYYVGGASYTNPTGYVEMPLPV